MPIYFVNTALDRNVWCRAANLCVTAGRAHGHFALLNTGKSDLMGGRPNILPLCIQVKAPFGCNEQLFPLLLQLSLSL